MRNSKSLSKLSVMFFILTGLSGCSIYPNKFKCGDAKGLGCTMLRDVDTQIDSGQIEEVYREDSKCRGRSCPSNDTGWGQSLLRPTLTHEAQTYDDIDYDSDTVEKENSLLF